MSRMGQLGMRGLQPVDQGVVERRDVAVLLAATGPSARPCGRARRTGASAAAAWPPAAKAGSTGSGSCSSTPMRHLTVTGTRTAAVDGGHALGDQLRLGHQAGAEAAVLHPVGRTADIEVDLVDSRSPPRSRRPGAQRRRIGAAELQRHRMLGRVEAQQLLAVAMDHRPGGDHLGIEQRPARQQTVEQPAMPVGPVHHRGNAEAP